MSAERELIGRAEAEIRSMRDQNLFHMVYRQMQAAYAAGLRDGPEAAMQWLAGALMGPGGLPSEGASPEWYAKDAWVEGPPWPTPPPENATIAEPTPKDGTP